MKKTLFAALLALAYASSTAYAQRTDATYTTSFDCTKASNYAEHEICNDKELADTDLAYWKQFQAARNASADKQTFHNHAITAFKYRQKCPDRECIVTWFKEQKKYLASLDVPSEATKTASAATTAVDDSGDDWMAYDTGLHACVRIQEKLGVSNPDQYAAVMSRNGRLGTVAKYIGQNTALIYIPALGDHQPTTILGKGNTGCMKIMRIANMYGE